MGQAAVEFLNEYQSKITAAYLALREGDSDDYTILFCDARGIIDEGKRVLRAQEFAVFERAAHKSNEVLQKCAALGLSNLEKRLKEFRLAESMTRLLSNRKRSLRGDDWLLAA